MCSCSLMFSIVCRNEYLLANKHLREDVILRFLITFNKSVNLETTFYSDSYGIYFLNGWLQVESYIFIDASRRV